jgi:hypothetical protein
VRFNPDDRDAFIRRMQRMRTREASISHHNGRMWSVGMHVDGEWRHLTFGDRPEDGQRVWVTVVRRDVTTHVAWVDGGPEEWLHVFSRDWDPPVRLAEGW